MTDPSRLEKLLRLEQQRQLTARDELPGVRARLLASVARRRRPRRWSVAVVGVLAAALASVWLGAVLLAGPTGAREAIQASPELTTRHAVPVAASSPGLPAPSTVSSGVAPLSTEDLAPRRVLAPRVVRPEPAAPSAPPSPSSSSPPPAAWKLLAIRGRYREALVEVEAAGFDALCRSSPANELLMLANTARFGGRLDRARQALLSLRERFPGAPERVVATFTLGRIAADDQRDDLAAAHWFETLVEENPGGDLAQEALGRLVECLERGGDHPTARRRAASYLSRYPAGPHASIARRVLDP